MNSGDVRKIKLANGETLELNINEGFYEMVRRKLILHKNENISNEHIKKFIICALNEYLEKNDAA
jgi:hypothetical protein